MRSAYRVFRSERPVNNLWPARTTNPIAPNPHTNHPPPPPLPPPPLNAFYICNLKVEPESE